MSAIQISSFSPSSRNWCTSYRMNSMSCNKRHGKTRLSARHALGFQGYAPVHARERLTWTMALDTALTTLESGGLAWAVLAYHCPGTLVLRIPAVVRVPGAGDCGCGGVPL